MMYGFDEDWGVGGWVLMSVLMLVIVGAMIVSVLALIRSTRASSDPPRTEAQGGSASALRTLD